MAEYHIRFERTFDYELVRQICTHPQVWRQIADDGTPLPDVWKPLASELMFYVLVYDGDELLGLWMLHPHNAICYEIHTCLLPNGWGDRSRAAAKLFPAWIWENTPARRVITNVPLTNRVALKFAHDAGMTEFGINPLSYLKHGVLMDQVCLGISP